MPTWCTVLPSMRNGRMRGVTRAFAVMVARGVMIRTVSRFTAPTDDLGAADSAVGADTGDLAGFFDLELRGRRANGAQVEPHAGKRAGAGDRGTSAAEELPTRRPCALLAHGGLFVNSRNIVRFRSILQSASPDGQNKLVGTSERQTGIVRRTGQDLESEMIFIAPCETADQGRLCLSRRRYQGENSVSERPLTLK